MTDEEYIMQKLDEAKENPNSESAIALSRTIMDYIDSVIRLKATGQLPIMFGFDL